MAGNNSQNQGADFYDEKAPASERTFANLYFGVQDLLGEDVFRWLEEKMLHNQVRHEDCEFHPILQDAFDRSAGKPFSFLRVENGEISIQVWFEHDDELEAEPRCTVDLSKELDDLLGRNDGLMDPDRVADLREALWNLVARIDAATE